MASNIGEWCDRIGEEFYLKSDKPGGQKYTVLSVDPDNTNHVMFEREDSWTFVAVNPVIHSDNSIEWDYSAAGRFTDERRVQEQYNKTHSLKAMLDKGAYESIVVYNKYGDFLAEGNPQELRQNGLWALLDEQNAVVKESYNGFTENGEPAMCFELRNFPPKDRSRAELQAQLTALQENADFTDIIDDDLRNEKINEFNMRVSKLKEHIESARFSELRKMPDTKLIEHFLENSKDLTDYVAYEEMKYRNLISKDDTFATLSRRLDYYNENPQFESVTMKDFTLIIDTSAANPEGGQIYVYEADTLQEVKDKLTELNLSFAQSDVYCATIGERNNGTLNRYQQIERTDDGVKWYADNSNGHDYIPFEWKTVDDWLNIEKFQVTKSATEPVQNTILMEEFNMETKITARVTPIENGSNLKGSATVTIGDQLSVHGVKVVQGEKGLFVSMPGEMSKNGKFYDTVLPKSKEAHALLESTVLSAYQDALNYGKQEKTELDPVALSVKVSNFRDNPYENNIKGDCQITINEMLVIKGVKVIQGKESGELSVALPSKQDQFGGYIPVANAITKDFYAQIKDAVIDHYQNRPQTLGNTSYGKLADKSQGEEILHKTYNSQFAEKVGEQLDADNVKWSAKLEGNGKTVIAVNKNDAEKLDACAEKAKALVQGDKPAIPAVDSDIPTQAPRKK